MQLQNVSPLLQQIRHESQLYKIKQPKVTNMLLKDYTIQEIKLYNETQKQSTRNGWPPSRSIQNNPDMDRITTHTYAKRNTEWKTTTNIMEKWGSSTHI